MEIKGTAVMAIRDFVKENYTERYQEWLESMPGNAKNIFTGVIDSSGWYPLELGGLQPTKKLAELFFKGDQKAGAWESGKFSAQKALSGIYKIFVKAATPSYIIQRASRVFSTYYRPCQMEVIAKKEKGVTVQISNMTQCDEVVEFRIGGWIQSALEISGAANITIDFPKSAARGDEVTIIDIAWQ